MSLWNLFLCGALCPSAEALGPGVGKDFLTQVSACQGSGPFRKFQRLHHPHGLRSAQPRLVQAAPFSCPHHPVGRLFPAGTAASNEVSFLQDSLGWDILA